MFRDFLFLVDRVGVGGGGYVNRGLFWSQIYDIVGYTSNMLNKDVGAVFALNVMSKLIFIFQHSLMKKLCC